MSEDDKLNTLKSIEMPAAPDAARQRALDAAMLAFDDAQRNSRTVPQGANRDSRLRSIFQALKGNWIMDTRISLGLGTAAVALLLLPLGYQLMTSTAITPVDFRTRDAVAPTTVTVEQNGMASVEPRTQTLSTEVAPEPTPVEAAPKREEQGLVDGRGDIASRPVRTVDIDANGNIVPTPGQMDMLAPANAEADFDAAAGEVVKRQTAPSDALDGHVIDIAGEPSGGALENLDVGRVFAPAPTVAQESLATAPSGYAMSDTMVAPPTSVASGDEFTDFEESPVKVVAEEPVSTFSIDVDTASYSYVRRMLEDGYMPEPDAVRIEEMINYFDYGYAGPESAEAPFKATMQIYPTPWNPKTELLQIGIKGYVPPVTEDKASNLTFLLDTSGSMDEPDKLPLLKRAFALLVDQLSANDTVSIVAYAGSAGVVLQPTKATDKTAILGALDNLMAGGSTAGAEGIELAYELAARNKVAGGINRVILATDGDFNVGIDDPEDLVDFIKAKRDDGIFLSVLGFGQGNLGDDTMQALAQNGNGNASYIDSYKEAQKVLVQEIGGTLETIAQDVKIQVEFNPAVVAEYRLVGYETRALNREDFNNDKVDAGDIGAGHTVTAIYEITPVGSGAELVDPLRYGGETNAGAPASGEIGFLKMRYKLPEGTTSELIETPITESLAVASVGAASEDARWAAAVAAFAQKLKGSSYGGTMSFDEIRTLAQGARGADEDGYRAEFMQLINSAETVSSDD